MASRRPTRIHRSGAAHRRRAAREEPKLSPGWLREIKRRLRDSRDPVRYMLVSEFARSFVLYYDVSRDVFTLNAPENGTLFKRREAAELVSKLLSHGVRIVKFTTKGGKLRRISPLRPLQFRTK